MASSEILTQAAAANDAARGAAWKGALALEDLALSAERLRETAYALACSESFDVNAQHAFYCFGEMVDVLHGQAKKKEDELTELSARYCAPTGRH